MVTTVRHYWSLASEWVWGYWFLGLCVHVLLQVLSKCHWEERCSQKRCFQYFCILSVKFKNLRKTSHFWISQYYELRHLGYVFAEDTTFFSEWGLCSRILSLVWCVTEEMMNKLPQGFHSLWGKRTWNYGGLFERTLIHCMGDPTLLPWTPAGPCSKTLFGLFFSLTQYSLFSFIYLHVAHGPALTLQEIKDASIGGFSVGSHCIVTPSGRVCCLVMGLLLFLRSCTYKSL